MSSVKIRLVKCPNCWNVLPESVDVPVYKCGGCGKILQAKYRQQQQQEEEDAEKSSDMQGGEDVGDKEASGSSKPEEQDNNDDEELNMPHNGVTEIAGDQNSHVSFVEDEEEINGGILTNNESDELQQSEEATPPIYFNRIMSGSTEYHDPCSTLSETCNSPTTTRYNYDASVSSLDIDNTRLDSRWFPVKPQPHPPPHDNNNSRWRRIRDSANGTTPYLDKRLPPRPRYHQPASPEYIDEQKIKLLKIVYELEEQLLKKTCSFQGGGVNKHRPTSRSHELLRPHWNNHDMVTSSSYSPSRVIPFSAGFALPRNRKLHSEPLQPPPYKKSIYRTRTGRSSIINSYSSWPSSPVDELLDGFQEMKIQTSNLKKKKQHLRPIARAAPFIACQNCSEFLQLPEDFLLFKGRCHRVRCGGCSAVMRFSLENGTYLVPYYQEEEEEDNDDLDFRAPPPSEADESSSMKMKMKMKMKMRSSSSSSTSRGKMTHCHSTGAPLHNLMGYCTVSRVFKGYGPSSSYSSDATSSMLNR